MQTETTRALAEKGINFYIKKHSKEVFTCEDAARERGVRISQIVKTMIAQDDKGNLHVCLIPGDKKLKLKKVRGEAGVKIDLVDPNKLSKSIGIIVGAISPLQFPQETNFYIDPTVLDEEFVDISSGMPDAGVELRSKDLVKILSGKLCDIISESTNS